MSLKQLTSASFALLLVAGLLAVSTNYTDAAIDHQARRDALRERIEQRRAEREADRNQEDNNEDQGSDNNQSEPDEEDSDEPECTCRASIGFGRPTLGFSNGTLTFVPRIDFNIRSRGDFDAPAWTATVDYEGVAAYESDDVAVPGPTPFSGSRQVASSTCGSNHSFKGLALNPVPLSGITSTLVGQDQELEGAVAMRAKIQGCGFDSEQRQLRFTLEDVLNLKVRGWRPLR